MSRIQVAPIVEGHGEDAALRTLIWRTWTEILGGEHAEVLRPIRIARGKLLAAQSGDLERAVNLAHRKLLQTGYSGLILLLIDAEDDCERLGPLGPLLLERARAARSDADISCVIANVMYETWIIGAVASLAGEINLMPDELPPFAPERDRLGKGWIKQRIVGGKYSETADQASLTAKMDLALCRQNCPSFDKLCRELLARKRS